MQELLSGLSTALDLIVRAYAAWPLPWNAALICVLGAFFGFGLTRFVRALLIEFAKYEITTRRFKLYASVAAFFFGAIIGTKFPIILAEPIYLWLHALAAGLLCAPLIDGSLRLLREKKPYLADAIDDSFDTTQEFDCNEAKDKAP